MNPQTIVPRNFLERESAVLHWCRGRRVLHLGCIGFTDCPPAEKLARARVSLHQKLTDISDCIGVDLDGATVRELRGQAIFTNVVEGNVEHLDALPPDLGKFDVVVAGDIIEHLSNPGLMLDGIMPLLRPGGVLVVSTPNAMGLPGFVRYARGQFREGGQHVLCFNPITLAQMLARHGYEVIEADACHEAFARKAHGSLFSLGRAFLRRFPKLGGTLIFVARPNTR